MVTARRFVKDESGMTLSMAMIMIVLIGAMGAGLLTFVMTDLNTVTEQNRGQTAFEVADAGIEAAKHQLAANVVTTDYDDQIKTPLAPDDDIQWSAAAGGVTLTNLGEGGATTDSVNVKIKYRIATTDFRVVSEGTYGVAKRKIEAFFEPKPVDFGEGNKGQPTYYTPSSIMLDGPNIGIKGISLFSREDILIEDARTNTTPAYSYACFQAEYENKADSACPNMPVQSQNPGTIAGMQGVHDELCDWDTLPPTAGNNCFKEVVTQGNYNTIGRLDKSNNRFQQVGFGAEGKICRVLPTEVNSVGVCGTTRPSIVWPPTTGTQLDGYAYDSTTSPQFVAKETLGLDPKMDANPTGTITYPFPRLTPNPEYFRCVARRDPPCANALSKSAGYWVGDPDNDPLSEPLTGGDPANLDWGLGPSTSDKVAFVDAKGGTVSFNPDTSGTSYKGVIVVWCGNLQQNSNFRGVVLNLYGDGLDGNTQCGNHVDGPSTSNVGVYTNNGKSCTCWVYAQGGTATKAGITLRPNSSADFLPAGQWDNLPTTAFEGPPPTEFVIRSWRELYE